MAQRPTSHTNIAVVHGLYHVTERRGAAAKQCVRYLYKTFKSCKNKKAAKNKTRYQIERRVCQIDVILLHASTSVRGETSRARGNEAWPYRGGVSGAVARVLRLCRQWGRQHGGTAHDGEKRYGGFGVCVVVLCRQLRIVISHFLAEIFTSPWTSFEAWTRTPQKRLVASSSPHTA